MNKFNTLIIGIFALFIMANINIPSVENNSTKPHIKFNNTKYNYGQMYQNANGKHAFIFKNTGKEPLIIQNVRSSCGCTIAKRPNAPILPGDSAEIGVKYDTRRIGVFHKNITVSSNADNGSVVLHIRGEVKQKPKEEVPEKKVNTGFTPVAR